MEVQEIAIADGKVESVRTTLMDTEVIFVDWQEVKWRMTFTNVLAVENLNIEGEELDRLEVVTNDDYVVRVRDLVDEPNAPVSDYMFFTPWKNKPRLRVVAGRCIVETVHEKR
jgi:hypothetical protein